MGSVDKRERGHAWCNAGHDNGIRDEIFLSTCNNSY